MRSIAEFKAWLKSVDIRPEYSLVEFRVEDDSWGVFAKENVPEDATLGQIPLSALLNAQTTEISHIFQQEKIEGNLALVIATAYERSLKEHSKWFGYFESMPIREDIPIFWSEKELEALDDADLTSLIHQQKERMQEDFDCKLVPLMAKYESVFRNTPLQFQDFQNATSLVSSRAFYIDKDHGLVHYLSFQGNSSCLLHLPGQSMVPFADVFNHKCSVVVIDQFHKVEVESSSSSSSSSDNEVDEEAEEEEEVITISDVPPEWRLEITICHGIASNMPVLDVKAAQPLAKGAEIHNTYGELSNEELLQKYGFCIEKNAFDFVPLSRELVLRHVQSRIPVSSFQRRLALLETTVPAQAEGEDSFWDFKVHARNMISNALLLVLEFLFAEEEQKAVQQLVDAVASLPRKAWSSDMTDRWCMSPTNQGQKVGKCLKEMVLERLESLSAVSDRHCRHHHHRCHAPCQNRSSLNSHYCHRLRQMQENASPWCRLAHVHALLESRKMILNAFIKSMDNVSDPGGLQHSTILTHSRMMINSEEEIKTSQSSLNPSSKKRKFLRIWCVADE